MLTEYRVIVNKSTVPVGTADIVREIVSAGTKIAFDVVSNPEFLREGAAVEDFLRPERVVIGSKATRAIEMMKRLYEPFVRSGNPIIVMDERSSELTKYAANAFLATKISFMNEVANLCEKVGADVDQVRRGIGTDSRIGKRFLFAGIGYGGSCFPKDVQAMDYTADQYGYPFQILKAVMEVNDQQKVSILKKVERIMGKDLKGKTIGIWGLAFKPETDDVREAPALYIAARLLDMGATLKAYDPEAVQTFKTAFGQRSSQITFVSNQEEVLKSADALVICTEWNEFRRPDFEKFTKFMKKPLIFDGRNLYDLHQALDAGLSYISVGRPEIHV